MILVLLRSPKLWGAAPNFFGCVVCILKSIKDFPPVAYVTLDN